MAVPKPSIHGRDHRPGGADPIPGMGTTIGMSRFVAYRWSSDASCKLPGDDTLTPVPWGTDGTGDVVTNDIPGLSGYGTDVGSTFDIIPGSRATPPGTGLWTGDNFEEFTVTTPVIVAARVLEPGLYLSWIHVSLQFDVLNPTDYTGKRMIVVAQSSGGGVQEVYDLRAATGGSIRSAALPGLALSDCFGRVKVAQDSGYDADWQVSAWSVRLHPQGAT